MASDEEPHVTSEINTFLCVTSEVKPLSKSSNKIARMIFSLPKDKDESQTPSKVDKDGDLIVRRKNYRDDLEESAMYIEYENSTTLKSVGLQVWRGAFLLADFILEFSDKYLKGKNVLELGTGTGLTSIVASMYAHKVYATDLNDPEILKLIESNVKHNEKFVKCDFHVKALDFTNLQWTPELEEFVSETDTILAADVVYSTSINVAFIQTLKKILSSGRKSKEIFIAMEKRYVFTIEDLQSLPPLYLHFLEELESTLKISSDSPFAILPGPDNSSIRLSMEQIPIDSFCQYFNYEKTKELVLWRLSSSIDQV